MTTYADPTTADAYHALRGNTAWAAAAPEDRASALVRATDHIDAVYRARSPRSDPAQALQWPTEGYSDVPASVSAACCILALEALSGPLGGRAERGVRSTAQSLDGVGSTSITYDDAPSDPFPDISALLSDIASRRGASVYIGRAIR